VKRRHLLNLLSFAIAIVLLAYSSAAFAGSIPDTGDPGEPVCNPRSFADLGSGIITDNVTGLMWQKDTAPGTYNTWRQARDYCSNLSLGGYTDWRLPTIEELSLLVDSSMPSPGPVISTAYFPDTVASFYWSSTPGAFSLYRAWSVDFSTGHVSYDGKRSPFNVRAVRGTTAASSFVDNGDGTVTDTGTNLMWEQATDKNTYTWKQAMAYCDNLTLGGHSDWRLPTRNELQSLVNYRRYSPAISFSYFPKFKTSYFPRTAPSYYWASTTSATSASGQAWFVNFRFGEAYYIDKMNYYHVRAVRSLQCGP
jgi:hypothetical protein